MANIFIRTVIVYLLVVLLMRFTGKRQIGQLELTELVTAFMVSELATNPIVDGELPLLYAIIPVTVLVSLEVFFSYGALKNMRFRRFFSGNALTLVKKGVPDEKEMASARITLDELLSAVRLAGVGSLNDVEYAILEQNGSISVLVKPENSPPSANALGVKAENSGLHHTVVTDGRIETQTLGVLGLDEAFVRQKAKENGFGDVTKVFFMSVDDSGNVVVFGKQAAS